ncbi:unnamed protein product [Pedinophyceae sp. YPF-701]|nr:unnamed protein product [Pedinophyceae sp. YPF-701]
MDGAGGDERGPDGNEKGEKGEQPVCTFFKKRGANRANVRKRAASNDAEDGGTAQDTTVVQKVTHNRPGKESALGFTTKDAGGEKGVEKFAFAASRQLQERDDGGATRTLDIGTEDDRDARALREKMLAQGGEQDDGVYRGMAAYTDWKKGFRRENTYSNVKKSGMAGPLRPSKHMRMTVQIDYKPDVCKDYKETGYCAWGDACKFLHDRGDYKQGWQLDQEWEAEQKRKEELRRRQAERGLGSDDEGSDEESEEDEDGVPFACLACRKPWAEVYNPVVTKCKHYFCERCALAHSEKSKRCPMCDQPHHGVFNVAHDVIKKEKARKQKEAAAAAK